MREGKIRLYKDGGVKIIDADGIERISMLKSLGWREEAEEIKEEESCERDDLLKEAESLGLKVHHKAGLDKIKSMIAEASK